MMMMIIIIIIIIIRCVPQTRFVSGTFP